MERRSEHENNFCQPSSSTGLGEQTRNPRVYMDLSLNKCPPKRIVIELFADLMPKTAENFRALCTGEMGIGKTTGKPLHYKGTVFHRLYPRLAAEGGDFSNHDGTGGESIFGGTFPAEHNPREPKSGPGVLMSANHIKLNTTGSLFLLCYTDNSILDMSYGEGSVFGQVTEGLDVISELRQRAESPARLEITDCGAYPDDDVTRADKPQSSSESEANLQKDREVKLDQWSQSPDLDSKRVKSSFFLEGNCKLWPELNQVYDEELTKKLLLTAEADLQSSPDEIPKSDESNAEILELNVSKELTKTHSPDLESKRVESRFFLEGNCVIWPEWNDDKGLTNGLLVTSEVTSEKPSPGSPEEMSKSAESNAEILDLNDFKETMKRLCLFKEIESKPAPLGSPDEMSESDELDAKRLEEFMNNASNDDIMSDLHKPNPVSEYLNYVVTESDKEIEIEERRVQHHKIKALFEVFESTAEHSELKRVANELMNQLFATQEKPSSYPLQQLDDTSISRCALILPSLRNRSKKSGSPVAKELEIEKLRGGHRRLIMLTLESEIHAEEKEADNKRTNSKVGWSVIAAITGAVIAAGVAYFRQPKFGVVHRERCKHCNWYY